LDADAHARQRRAGRVGHAAADRPALSGEPTGGREQRENHGGDDTDEASHRLSFMFRGVTAATNPHAARYTAGWGGRQATGGRRKKNRRPDVRPYGVRGWQLAGRPRALHSSVGIGMTVNTLSPATGLGSPGLTALGYSRPYRRASIHRCPPSKSKEETRCLRISLMIVAVGKAPRPDRGGRRPDLTRS